MLAPKKHSRGWLVLLGLFLGVGGFAAQSGHAQQNSDGGFAVSEAGEAQTPDPVPSAGNPTNTGPVRLARFAYVQGNVSWRADETADWSKATVNLPMRQDAQIWVTDGGRAEIQFDDGSLLRLGNGAIVTLQTLYSDNDGEFTELKMTGGLAALRLRHDRAVYQVNTPLGSLKAVGPAGLRIGVGNGLEVAIQSGKATIEGSQSKADLQGGDFLDLANADSPYTIRDIPLPDSWDRWNKERDDLLTHAADEPATQHLPLDLSFVAQDLSDQGTWHDDQENGWVWSPNDTTPDWRPYEDGQWTFVNPFGWTWVSAERWGWVPYHYGTWIHRPYGWAWCPGPVNQYWSPAVVHFSEYNGRIGWCPLAPGEVRYPPAIAFGFRAGNWAAYFSIGGAAVYYPTTAGYCVPRVYNTVYVNRVTYVSRGGNGNGTIPRLGFASTGFASNNNTFVSGSVFVPINSRTAAGVTAVASTQFGGRGSYIAVAKADTTLFVQGRAVGAPPLGSAPLAGPVVKPTPQAMTPTHTFVVDAELGPARQALPVYRAPISGAIARNSAPITPTGRIVTPSQNSYLSAPNGQNGSNYGNVYNRAAQNDRTASGFTRSNGATGQDQSRTQSLSRGNGNQNPYQNPYQGQGRNGTTPANGGNYQNRNSSGSSSAGSSSAADAAAAARSSIGYSGSSGNNSNGNGNGSYRQSPYNGSSGSNSSGGSYNSGNSGNGGTTRPPLYNGSNGSGSTGSGSAGSGAGSNGSSGSTTRTPQTGPARSDGSTRSNPPPASGGGGGGAGSSGSGGSKGATTNGGHN